MPLSNHEKMEFVGKLSRMRKTYGTDTTPFDWMAHGLREAFDHAHGDDFEKLSEKHRMIMQVATEIRTENDAAHIAMTRKALTGYESRDDKIACLQRMGWSIDDAVEAGLIEEDA